MEHLAALLKDKYSEKWEQNELRPRHPLSAAVERRCATLRKVSSQVMGFVNLPAFSPVPFGWSVDRTARLTQPILRVVPV